MTAIEKLVDYLVERVRAVNPAHINPHKAGLMLQLSGTYEEMMEAYIYKSLSILQLQFSRDTSQSPAGTTTLTNASTKIGQAIARRLGKEYTWSTEIALGDLFIEAFYTLGFIDLSYAKTRNSKHIVSVSPTWSELAELPQSRKYGIRLYATSETQPEDITGMYQEVNGVRQPIVKNALESDPIDCQAPWVRALNNLQQTAWVINEPVYHAMLANQDIFVSYEPIEDNEIKELKRRSKVVEWAFISEKAKKLLDYEEFYQYLDVDYRGRFYYCESFLNFQGSDLARGLFKFKHKKPMTQEGLYWLSIHTASVFNMSYGIDEIPDWVEVDYKSHLEKEGLDNISVDKMTLNDRVQWTAEYMDEILYAGQHHSLSEEADKPISFLAACIEWYEFMQKHNNNQIHMTSLPIPIDGSNNGWQHLGAISKDTQTGELVGLVPSEIQKDFYVATAKKLIELVDASKNERLKDILSSMPMKAIRKGISKRGSMTKAYSAGAKKIAENMYNDCRGEDYHIKYGITQDDCTKLSKYLVKAIEIVCPGPLETMKYLQELAVFRLGKYDRINPKGTNKFQALHKRHKELYKKNFISDEELEELNDISLELREYTTELSYGQGFKDVRWKTPSGFHVTYEAWQMREQKCKSRIKGYTSTGQITHVAQVSTKMPDIQKFMCGISPNFIHSMDASHMSLVIDNWDGCFGAVHDSFSTHAGDVDRLVSLTKNVFISMYEYEDYYNVISMHLTDGEDDVEKPTIGSLDINLIEESDFFFA